MLDTPSIVLEGASSAADWIPFARVMLNSMVGDGTINSSPEDKITIVVTRYGAVSKIYIKAGYPLGGRFVGRPYDEAHLSGWGTPFQPTDPNDPNDQNFKGTEGSHKNSHVIIGRQSSVGEWEEQRYPVYQKEYVLSDDEELRYGNLDWTSKDGETVITWDGMNTRHYGSVPVKGYIEDNEQCCSENIPANAWHLGYLYPGFFTANGNPCDPNNPTYPTGLFRVNYTDGDLTSNIPDWGVNSRIYKDGKVLIEIPHEYQMINGAAIQAGITEQDPNDSAKTIKRDYLVAVLAELNTNPGAGVTKEVLFRAPMDDLEKATYTDIIAQVYSGFAYAGMYANANCWEFDSTGFKAVAVRYFISTTPLVGMTVIEMILGTDGSLSTAVLWQSATDGIIGKMEHQDSYAIGEHALFSGIGTQVIGAAYKDDVLNYAVIGGNIEGDYSYDVYDPTDPACDVMTETKIKTIDMKFAFTSVLPVGESIPSGAIIAQKSNDTTTVTSTRFGSPEYLIKTTVDAEVGYPLFIDCRKSMVVFQRTKEPSNRTVIGQNDIGAAALIPDQQDPLNDETYDYDITLEIYVESGKIYESAIFRQYRSPGDCYLLSAHGLNAGLNDCDLVTTTIYTVTDYEGVSFGTVATGDFALGFANVQIHDDGSKEGGFDIIVSLRTRYDDPSAPVESFVARWDGIGLTDVIQIKELLQLDRNGVLAPNGKI